MKLPPSYFLGERVALEKLLFNLKHDEEAYDIEHVFEVIEDRLDSAREAEQAAYKGLRL